MLMSHKSWLEGTRGGFLQKRSKLLRAVDESLYTYEHFGAGGVNRSLVEPTFARQVAKALAAWKKSKADWSRSARNKRGAVDLLSAQLRLVEPSPEERRALKEVLNANRAYVGKLFAHRSVVPRNEYTRKKIGRKENPDQLRAREKNPGYWKIEAGKAALQAELLSDKIEELVAEHVPTVGIVEVVIDWLQANVLAEPDLEFLELVLWTFETGLEELLASIVPYVGLGFSAARSVEKGAQLSKMLCLQDQVVHAPQDFGRGDPITALKAVRELLDREVNKNLLLFASFSTETAAKTAGILADGGTLTTAIAGAVASAARLLLKLHNLRRDYLEMKRARELLEEDFQQESELFGDMFMSEEELVERQGLRRKLFDEFPLAGAYFIASADTSVLINVLHDHVFCDPAYMLRVERAVRESFEPVRKAAHECIKQHRLCLTGDWPKLSIVHDHRNFDGQYIRAANTVVEQLKFWWADRKEPDPSGLRTIGDGLAPLGLDELSEVGPDGYRVQEIRYDKETDPPISPFF